MQTKTLVVALAVVACGGAPMQSNGTGGGSTTGTGGGSAGGGQGGGAGGGTSAGATCLTATASLCDRALGCGTATKLVVSVSSGTAEHQSLGDCTNYYRYLVCPSAEGDAGARDWAACAQAISAASCATSSIGPAIPLPTQCVGLTL